jgi:hypothetical protein
VLSLSIIATASTSMFRGIIIVIASAILAHPVAATAAAIPTVSNHEHAFEELPAEFSLDRSI